MSNPLRIIGDVHAQINRENLFTREAKPYLEIIEQAPYSVQLGDMGDGETYDELMACVDPNRHRFFPGNHENYDRLPPHSLGDFGHADLGGVDFFFVRGAGTTGREELLRLGREQGKKLWFEEEELTRQQMELAEQDYLRARPVIMLSHDGPTPIAQRAREHARRLTPPNSKAAYIASPTTDFLARLLELHQPKIWLLGHHHHNWRFRDETTLFVCVGELSFVDIDAAGNVISPKPARGPYKLG